MEARFSLVVPAAGEGRRLAAGKAKVFVDLSGAPMLCRTMECFDGIARICERIVAVRPCDAALARKCLQRWNAIVVEGGMRRQDSVRAALAAATCEYVVVHDAARPFVSRELVERVLDEAVGTGAAIAAIPVTDTVKQTGDNNIITGTVPRENLWAAQTPQAFRTDLLRNAFERIGEAATEITDDSQVVETTGHPVRIVPGETGNMKITTAEDLARTAK